MGPDNDEDDNDEMIWGHMGPYRAIWGLMGPSGAHIERERERERGKESEKERKRARERGI